MLVKIEQPSSISTLYYYYWSVSTSSNAEWRWWRHSNLSPIGGYGHVTTGLPQVLHTKTNRKEDLCNLPVRLCVCEEGACPYVGARRPGRRCVLNEGRRGRACTGFMRCGWIERRQSGGRKTSVGVLDGQTAGGQTGGQTGGQVGCCRTADSTLSPLLGLFHGGGSRTGAATRSPEQEPHSDTPTPGRGEGTMGSASSSYRVIYLDVDGRIQKVRHIHGTEAMWRQY